jgi:hypothetical protein
MRDIIVEFSGWVRLSPASAKFVKIGEQDERPDIITGEAWQQLDDDDQGNYILEDVRTQAGNPALVVGDYQQIDVFVDDSP